mmetsp:Transcript_6515/g.14078  ORF Transcript_6515/g.14078 Transcript_6515/m.14078 type:complete len:385 (+) Transcript_6515:246-1400(+)
MPPDHTALHDPHGRLDRLGLHLLVLELQPQPASRLPQSRSTHLRHREPHRLRPDFVDQLLQRRILRQRGGVGLPHLLDPVPDGDHRRPRALLPRMGVVHGREDVARQGAADVQPRRAVDAELRVDDFGGPPAAHHDRSGVQVAVAEDVAASLFRGDLSVVGGAQRGHLGQEGVVHDQAGAFLLRALHVAFREDELQLDVPHGTVLVIRGEMCEAVGGLRGAVGRDVDLSEKVTERGADGGVQGSGRGDELGVEESVSLEKLHDGDHLLRVEDVDVGQILPRLLAQNDAPLVVHVHLFLHPLRRDGQPIRTEDGDVLGRLLQEDGRDGGIRRRHPEGEVHVAAGDDFGGQGGGVDVFEDGDGGGAGRDPGGNGVDREELGSFFLC